MTKENAKDYLPLVQALAEGKTIQKRYGISSAWNDISFPDFMEPPDCYRIKPSPKRVPLIADDLAEPQCWLKHPMDNTCFAVSSILGDDSVSISKPDGHAIFSFVELQQAGWLYAPSHKGPWTPCWKEVE